MKVAIQVRRGFYKYAYDQVGLTFKNKFYGFGELKTRTKEEWINYFLTSRIYNNPTEIEGYNGTPISQSKYVRTLHVKSSDKSTKHHQAKQLPNSSL